jgi:transcriptional regulator with XRE-family HTH domain
MPRVASPAAAFIGKRIVDARQRLSMSQDQVAAVSGIDSSNIRAYENGRALPSIHSLVRVALALGLEPGRLLDGITSDLFAASDAAERRRAG